MGCDQLPRASATMTFCPWWTAPLHSEQDKCFFANCFITAIRKRACTIELNWRVLYDLVQIPPALTIVTYDTVVLFLHTFLSMCEYFLWISHTAVLTHLYSSNSISQTGDHNEQKYFPRASANRKCEFKASAGRATGLMYLPSSNGSEPWDGARYAERWVWPCGLACMCVGGRPGRLTKYTSQQQGPIPLWRLYKWDLLSVTWLSVSCLCLYITQLSQPSQFTKLDMTWIVSLGCHWCPTWKKQTLVCSPSRKSSHSLLFLYDSHMDWQCMDWSLFICPL